MSPTESRSEAGARLPFGPYRDQPVASVAVMDPDYLLDLLREAVGPAELRAEAARILVQRGKLVAPRPRPDSARSAEDGSDSSAPPPLGNKPEATSAALVPSAGRHIPVHGEDRPAANLLVQGSPTADPELGSGPFDAAASPSRSIAWLIGGLAGLAILLLVLRYEGGANGFGGGPDSLFAPASGSSAGHLGTGDEASTSAISVGSSGAAGAPPSDPTPAFDPSQPCGARVAGAIPATSAGDFLDSYQAVEFQVVRSKDTGRVTFLNSHDPYQGHFYVAIFPDDYAAFPQPPARHFQGRCVVVQGSVETYRGAPQIVLRDPGDIRIVEPDPGTSGVATSKAAGDDLPTGTVPATEDE